MSKTHYNYYISLYHTDTVTSINYITVKISINSFITKSQSVCLDSDVTYMLIDCSIAAENLLQSSKMIL